MDTVESVRDALESVWDALQSVGDALECLECDVDALEGSETLSDIQDAHVCPGGSQGHRNRANKGLGIMES